MKTILLAFFLSLVSIVSMQSKASAANNLQSQSDQAPRIQGGLQYFGGPVISQVQIISVFWTSKVNSVVQKNIGGFYTALTNSTFLDWLSEYNTTIQGLDGRAGTGQQIGRGSFKGNFTILPSTRRSVVDDSVIQNELSRQIASGRLPKPNGNSLYMIHFPAGITITTSNSGGQAVSCQDFCAYHSSTVSNGQNIYYGVLPDQSSGPCARGCGVLDSFSNLTATSSHEITESITDPEVGSATGGGVGFPLGWYDSVDNGEIGDLCTGSTGTIKTKGNLTFVVQAEWSNLQNACVVGPALPH